MPAITRQKLSDLMLSDSNVPAKVAGEIDGDFSRISNASDPNPMSSVSSPYTMSPFNSAAPSPYIKSPWFGSSIAIPHTDENHQNPNLNLLIGSLVREEGHVYSLAASGNLLYTGSESKNIRVWQNQKEFSGFKSASGLVKAIVIAGEKIFTGHQDGKIRIWKISSKNPTVHKRLGTLPRLKDLIKTSIYPSNYIETRRHRSSIWIKHFDAVSCLCLDENLGLLYSGSWDKTIKVWRISDSKCLESINAHDDAVNAVVAAFDGLVFTGSADGTVKVWRSELYGKYVRHLLFQTLLRQDSAVTSLAVDRKACVVYGGSSDGLVNFWEMEKHLSHGGALRGHKMAVLCLAAAGNLVFTGSADKTISVWRREGGVHTCLSVLNGHMGPIKCLAVEEDGEFGAADGRWIVYSGSLDKSVKVWKVAERALHHDHMVHLQQQNVRSDLLHRPPN